MADYPANIANLEAAAATGELIVKVDGREVQYRSMDDLLRALAYFQGKLADQAATSGGPAYPGVTLATFG